jgi:hypothetical protein
VASLSQTFAIALASKGPTTFITTFDAQGRMLNPGEVMTASAFLTRGIRLLVTDRFAPIEFAEAAKRHELDIIAPEFDPIACAEISRDMQAIDPIALSPLYPREPEAVTKWRELRGTKSL